MKQQPLRRRTPATSSAQPTTKHHHHTSTSFNAADSVLASYSSGWPILSTTEQLTIRDLARQAEEATRDVVSWDMADDEDIVSTFYPEDSAQVVQHTLKELELIFGKKKSRMGNYAESADVGVSTDSEAVSSIMRTLSHLINTLIFAPTNTTRCSTYLSSYEQLLLENKKLVERAENLKELLEVEESINAEIKIVLKIPNSNTAEPSPNSNNTTTLLDRTSTAFHGDATATSAEGGGVLTQLANRRLEDRIKLLEQRFAESSAQNRVLCTKNVALQHALRQSLETMYGPDQGRAFAKLNYADLDPKEGEATAIQEVTSVAEEAILNSHDPTASHTKNNSDAAATTLLGATERLVFQSNAELAAILNMVVPRQPRKPEAV